MHLFKIQVFFVVVFLTGSVRPNFMFEIIPPYNFKYFETTHCSRGLRELSFFDNYVYIRNQLVTRSLIGSILQSQNVPLNKTNDSMQKDKSFNARHIMTQLFLTKNHAEELDRRRICPVQAEIFYEDLSNTVTVCIANKASRADPTLQQNGAFLINLPDFSHRRHY